MELVEGEEAEVAAAADADITAEVALVPMEGEPENPEDSKTQGASLPIIVKPMRSS